MQRMLAIVFCAISSSANAVVGAMNANDDFDGGSVSGGGLLFATIVIGIIFYVCHRHDNK